MNRETFRMVGAITGLVLGLALMNAIGMGGLLASAVFGAGGSVIGGVSGERLHDRSRS